MARPLSGSLCGTRAIGEHKPQRREEYAKDLRAGVRGGFRPYLALPELYVKTHDISGPTMLMRRIACAVLPLPGTPSRRLGSRLCKRCSKMAASISSLAKFGMRDRSISRSVDTRSTILMWMAHE